MSSCKKSSTLPIISSDICIDSDQLKFSLSGPNFAVLLPNLAADDGLVRDGNAEVGLGCHHVG